MVFALLSHKKYYSLCSPRVYANSRKAQVLRETVVVIIGWMKIQLFQAAVVSILLDGCTAWTSTKSIEKKLDRNCTRMLWAIVNKSWKQHLTKQQQYGHQHPISKTILIRWTRHAGGRTHGGGSPMDPFTDMLLFANQQELTYNLFVRTQNVI